MTISIHSPNQYYASIVSSKAIETSFILLVMFLFFMSMAFYLVSRRRHGIYLNYAIYLFTVLYFFAYQFGFLSMIMPWVSEIDPSLMWISSASITMTYILFAMSFLSTRKTDLTLHHVFYYGNWFVAFVVTAESISYLIDGDIQHSIFFTVFTISVQSALMITIIYRVLKMRTMLSTIFIFGAAILMMTTLTGQLASTFKLVEQTNNLIMLGLSLEIFIFQCWNRRAHDAIQQGKRSGQKMN